MDKAPDAFRTISEVADYLETPAHVLRFWETRFPQVKPVKGAGGRRYYRPSDVALLAGIRRLLHNDGMTIRGVQKILRDQGVRHVAELGGEDPGTAEALSDLLPPPRPPAEIVPLRPTPAEAPVLPPLSPALGGFGGFGLDLDAPRSGEGGFIAFSAPPASLAPRGEAAEKVAEKAPEKPLRRPEETRQPWLFDLPDAAKPAPTADLVPPDRVSADLVADALPEDAPPPEADLSEEGLLSADFAEAEMAEAGLLSANFPESDLDGAEVSAADLQDLAALDALADFGGEDADFDTQDLEAQDEAPHVFVEVEDDRAEVTAFAWPAPRAPAQAPKEAPPEAAPEAAIAALFAAEPAPEGVAEAAPESAIAAPFATDTAPEGAADTIADSAAAQSAPEVAPDAAPPEAAAPSFADDPAPELGPEAAVHPADLAPGPDPDSAEMPLSDDSAANVPHLAGLAARLRALQSLPADALPALADLQARLGLLQAQMAEAGARPPRNPGA